MPSNREELNTEPTHEGLRRFAAELGFVETPELVGARQDVLSAESRSDVIGKMTVYQSLVEERQNDERAAGINPKMHIGYSLEVAGMKYAKGMYLGFSDAVYDAWEYAHNMGYDDVADRISNQWFNNPHYIPDSRNKA